MIFAVLDDKNYDLLACARSLCALDDKVCAIHISNKLPENLDEIFFKGADIIYSIIDEKLSEFNGKLFAQSLCELIRDKNPSIVIFSATQNGRELAPRVSTTFNTGLTADCTSLSINDSGKLASIRPTFGGRLMAEILCKTSPQMSTLRQGAYGEIEYFDSPKILEVFKPSLNDISSSVQIIQAVEDVKECSNLLGAKIIFAGGKGLKTKENFEKLEKIAQHFNAALGASRGAVEMGIAPKSAQVGQTGLCVSPKLYIAFGISGAIHHMIGIENAQTIIAVNNDQNAPIFSSCDYKINTCAISLIDELIANL